MADALDILDVDRMDGPELTKDHFLGPGSSQRKSSKAPAAKRPEGMSREVFALLHRDGAQIDTPLTPTDTPSGYHQAKARLGLKKVRPWRWTPFVHPGRTDNAVLFHWRRACDVEQEYAFAKFCKKLVVDSFTEDEYYKYVHDVKIDWSYAETEFLFDLCGRFEVRFIVVHDRYNAARKFPPRTLEEIKERYYEVVNKLNKVRNPGGDTDPEEKPPSEGPKATLGRPTADGSSEVANNGEPGGTTFKDYGVGFVFDGQTEYKRKFQLNRNQEEIDEEQYVAVEFKRILARKREEKKKAKESAAAAIAVAAGVAAKPVAKKKAILHAAVKKNEPVEPPTTKEASTESKKIKLVFPEKSRCYSALSRILPQTTDSVEGRKMKYRLAQVDQHLTSMLGVPHLTIGSDELCDKYNNLRSCFAGLYELGTSLSAAKRELKALVDLYEKRKPVGYEDLGIPTDLLPSISSSEAASSSSSSSASSLGSMSPASSIVELGTRSDIVDVAGRAQRSISEMIQLEGAGGTPTRKRKAALEQSNVLKKLKSRP